MAWEIETVPENGDCFFLCMSRQLCDLLPTLTVTIQREWIVDYLLSHTSAATQILQCWQQLHRDEPESLEYRFMTGVNSIEALAEAVKDRTRFWAEHVSIQIVLDRIAEHIGRPLHLQIWREDETSLILKSRPVSSLEPYQTYLFYKQNKHYQPLVYSGYRIFGCSTIE